MQKRHYNAGKTTAMLFLAVFGSDRQGYFHLVWLVHWVIMEYSATCITNEAVHICEKSFFHLQFDMRSQCC